MKAWIASLTCLILILGCGGNNLKTLKAGDLVGAWDYVESESRQSQCLTLSKDGSFITANISKLNLLEGKQGTPVSSGVWKLDANFSPPRLTLCFRNVGVSGEDYFVHLPLQFNKGDLRALTEQDDPSDESSYFLLTAIRKRGESEQEEAVEEK